jgi:hypothetical protein
MKHVLWIAVLAACALDDPDLDSVEQHLNGDTWVSADTSQLAPARPRDVAFADDPLGRDHDVYVVGAASSGEAWSFRRSADGGVTWSNGPTFSLAPGKRASAKRIAVGHDGRILVSGLAVDSQDREHLITRLSTNKGQSFTTVDDVLLASGEGLAVTSLTFQSNAQAIVAASQSGTRILRRSAPGGTAWSPLAAPVGATIVNFCASGANLIAVGNHLVRAENRAVTYRLAGDTWTLLDSVTATAPNDGVHSSCIQNGSALFVAGRMDGDWRVRRSTNNGVSWRTVDSVPCVAGPINDMGVGRRGRTYLIGRCQVDNPGFDDPSYWRVRRTDDGGLTWVDSDLVTPALNSDAFGEGYAYDPDTEDTIAVGYGTTSGVRRLKH